MQPKKLVWIDAVGATQPEELASHKGVDGRRRCIPGDWRPTQRTGRHHLRSSDQQAPGPTDSAKGKSDDALLIDPTGKEITLDDT